MGSVRNYARFYRLLEKMSYVGDKSDLKSQLVLQYTFERTEHLHEMEAWEYRNMCDAMEILTGERQRLRQKRSQVLKQMQRMGVMTNDWQRVNALCRDPRIAGNDFARLDCDELETLRRKLYAIERNGGFSKAGVHDAGKSLAGGVDAEGSGTRFEC